MDWVWLDATTLIAVHDAQLAEHGGGVGMRDRGLLESVLGRPINLAAYGQPDAADLVAAYGFGIARNYPFVDGNKRTAFVAIELFLIRNAYELTADDAAAVHVMLGLATGEMTEAVLAEWIRRNMRALS